jgi:pimeloyl-ACP methyl ester carboxylesterase
VKVVFVHGAGRAGSDAWPQQAAARQARPGGLWHFLPRGQDGDDAGRDAQRVLVRLRAGGGGHVVAHSYGGNAALLAAGQEPDLVRSLVLFEPACLDLARGGPAVEEHIAAMAPVFDVADDLSVSAREFSARFAAATGTEPPRLPERELEEAVARLRGLRPPWGTGLQPRLPVPTLVVTGGWSELYEEIARALVALGARHVVLSGRGHRVQDHPDASRLLGAFLVEHEPPTQDRS